MTCMFIFTPNTMDTTLSDDLNKQNESQYVNQNRYDGTRCFSLTLWKVEYVQFIERHWEYLHQLNVHVSLLGTVCRTILLMSRMQILIMNSLVCSWTPPGHNGGNKWITQVQYMYQWLCYDSHVFMCQLWHHLALPLRCLYQCIIFINRHHLWCDIHVIEQFITSINHQGHRRLFNHRVNRVA